MNNDNRYRLHDSLGYQLSMAARIQERRLDEGLRTYGLTRISWCVMLAVGSEGLAQPSEIAEFVGIDRTATSRLLRQMEAAGLISRKSGNGDRRTTNVQLTAQGRQVMERATPHAVENNQVMLDRLGEVDFARLTDLLREVRKGDLKPLSGL